MRIEQRGEKDCGIAAAAMFLGITYDLAAEWFPDDAAETGVYLADIKSFIKAQGIEVSEWILRRGKPLPKVFAVLETEVNKNDLRGHFVLATPEGKVLDPHPSRPGVRDVSQYTVLRAIFERG